MKTTLSALGIFLSAQVLMAQATPTVTVTDEQVNNAINVRLINLINSTTTNFKNKNDLRAIDNIVDMKRKINTPTPANTTTTAIATAPETNEEKEKPKLKSVRIGVGIGWRVPGRLTPSRTSSISDKYLLEAYIAPSDTSLHIDFKPGGAVTLSALITYYPLMDDWKNLGFVANFNLAELSTAGSTFNKVIEGGIGFSYRFKKNFGIAATYELIFDRRIRDYYVDEYDKAKINGLPYKIMGSDGKAITSLNESDNTYFKNDNLGAFSIRFVFYLK